MQPAASPAPDAPLPGRGRSSLVDDMPLLGLEPPGNNPAGIFHIWQTYYSYYLGAGIKKGTSLAECVGLDPSNRTHLTTVTLPKGAAAG